MFPRFGYHLRGPDLLIGGFCRDVSGGVRILVIAASLAECRLNVHDMPMSAYFFSHDIIF